MIHAETPRPFPSFRIAALVLMLSLAAGACAGDQSATPPTSVPENESPSTAPVLTSSIPATTVPKSRGWIEGEPNWSAHEILAEDASSASPIGDVMAAGEAFAVGGGSGELAAVSPERRKDVLAKKPASPEKSSDAVAPAEPVSPDPSPDESPYLEDVVSPQSNAPLRAGSVDDNTSFDDYLNYRTRIEALEIPARSLDVRDRSVVNVRTKTGRAVAGVAVTFRSGDADVATLRTTADGSVRFHPRAYGVTGPVIATAAGVSAPIEPNKSTSITVDSAVTTSTGVDILFLLDATGSMGDEIDRLKVTIDDVASRVEALNGVSDVRLGMTLYRDEGDAFVTSTFDFTSSVAEFREALAKVVADGGGDYPEAVDEGFSDALRKPSWREPGSAIQLVFLVGDAPPQVQRVVETPYTETMKTAAARGIKVFPIASSESDDQAEYVFRQMAQFTGARFVFLAYGAEGGGTATGASTNIASTDYEELSLNDLVVRLVGEEAAARAGASKVVLPPSNQSTITTRPNGQ